MSEVKTISITSEDYIKGLFSRPRENDRIFCNEERITLQNPMFLDFHVYGSDTTNHLSIKTFFQQSIEKVEFYPPATKVTFRDGEVVTVAARHEDEFNEEVGVMHCILKRIFGGTGYNSMIRSLIKETHKREAAEFLKKEKEREEKEAEAKAKAEAREKERKRLAREREEKIEIQKEAYLRAMKEMEEKK